MNIDNTEHSFHGDILIVDDNTIINDFLLEFLGKVGYQVRVANDGESALRSVQARIPELVLLDYKMPGMNGIEVCQRLKANPETKDIPVIFLSGLGETDLKVQALEAGAIDYIIKPIELSEVLVKIDIHLSIYRLKQKLELQSKELLKEIKERR